MNKFIFNFSLLILAFSLLFCAVSYRQRPYSGVLRLHILANSDSARDQSVKMLVRNAVLETERELLAEAESRDEAAELLMADAGRLIERVDLLLRENGCAYSSRLCMGVYAFPGREYGGRIYPEGDYSALRIVLGEGKGHNWWCVLFPPLCILEGPNGEIEYEEDGSIKWKSLLSEWSEKGENENEQKKDDNAPPAAFDAASAYAVRVGGLGGGDTRGQQGRGG